MDYFKNDSEATGVQGMSIENGIGEVNIHGSITINHDDTSLQSLNVLIKKLSELKSSLHKSIGNGETLEGYKKPDIILSDKVENPF